MRPSPEPKREIYQKEKVGEALLIQARRNDKIQALMEKLASLENVVRSTTPQGQAPAADPVPASGTNNPATASKIRSTGNDGISPRPVKRNRVDPPSTVSGRSPQDILSPPESVTSQLRRDDGARDHIEKELSLNASLATHQRSVLETAIAFIDQLNQAPSNSVDDVEREAEAWDTSVSTEFEKGELLQLIAASTYSPAGR